MAAIPGTASAPQAFCGDASSRNEKSGNLTSCLLAGGVLFRPLAIRYDVLPGHKGCGTPGSQKAPSTKRCIKTRRTAAGESLSMSVRKHRAPNGALRRFEAAFQWPRVGSVRKHRAPNGALRLSSMVYFCSGLSSQKAPSTKRCIKTRVRPVGCAGPGRGQKAPSTKRCIKTPMSLAS